PDALQPSGIPFAFEGRLEIELPVEMVLDRLLRPTCHQEDISQTRSGRLLDDVLDGRSVDDRQHLLRHRLRGREEARSLPSGRYYRLRHWHSETLVAAHRGGTVESPRRTHRPLIKAAALWYVPARDESHTGGRRPRRRSQRCASAGRGRVVEVTGAVAT